MKSVFLALSIASGSVAVAAPTFTVAATDIKQLQFDITPLTRVNSYELWFKANPGAPWVKYAQTPAQRPRIRINTSVHLLDWTQARYIVKACNPSGCTASSEAGVDGEQLAAIGYFKPATTGRDQYFGFNFAVSADGTTLVVLATEKIDHVAGLAGIHVYRKTTSTSAWRLDAHLFPTPNEAGGGSSVAGDPLAISADGKTIAFGNWIENGYAGGVYLFRRAADGWHQTQRITGVNAGTAIDQFGINVKFDAAGETLAIGHNQSGGVKREGTLEVYKDSHDASGLFVHATTVPTPEFEDPQWNWCRAFALSEEGHIVRSCFNGGDFYTQVLTATTGVPLLYLETARLTGGSGEDVAIDSAGKRALVQDYSLDRSRVLMYRRDAGGWVSDGVLAPFGGLKHSAMSGDGKIVAIGFTDDTLSGQGPLFPPYQNGDPTGSVAIYERRASGWALRRFIKAGANHVGYSFGWEVSLDQLGHVLAVGSPYDMSKATGIDGDRDDASVQGRGAVWLY